MRWGRHVFALLATWALAGCGGGGIDHGWCGDGVRSGREACDEGTLNGTPTANCSTSCEVILCGNGVVDATETCDDGNRVDGDACRRDCTTCGDGVVQWSETCDDGNADPDDGCDACLRPGDARAVLPVDNVVSVRVTDRIYAMTFGPDPWIQVLALDGAPVSELDYAFPTPASGANTGAFVADAGGRVFATRSIDTANTTQAGPNLHAVSFLATGETKWVLRVPPSVDSDSYYADDVKLSAAGAWLAFGGLYQDALFGGSYTNQAIYFLVAADTGVVRWQKLRENGSQGDRVAVGDDGRLCGSGSTPFGSTTQHWLACYAPDGTELWARTRNDETLDLAMTADGVEVITAKGVEPIELATGIGRGSITFSTPPGITIAGLRKVGAYYLLRGHSEAGPELRLYGSDGREVWYAAEGALTETAFDADLGADGRIYAVYQGDAVVVFDPKLPR